LNGTLRSTQNLRKWDLEAHTEVSTLSSLLKGASPEKVAKKITEVTKDIVNVSTSCLYAPLHALVTITVVEVSFFCVTQHLVGLTGLPEDLGRFRIVRILVRVVSKCDTPKGFFDVSSIRVPLDA
tara:strand:- start:55 stop:429 length:375 start_codon:yes stop_codon:yes gene_type:complete